MRDRWDGQSFGFLQGQIVVVPLASTLSALNMGLAALRRAGERVKLL
jgi:hypothetical protein